jgi:uncharacterized protein (TIGR03435 family)
VKILLLAALLAGVVNMSHAQSFEVASIKPANPDERGIYINIAGATLTTTAFTVSLLIQEAYDVRSFAITGAPDWIKSQYNMIAKSEAGYCPPGHRFSQARAG